MNNRKREITEELKQMNSPLADLDIRDEVDIPAGYFEKLENEIIGKTVNAKLKPRIVSISFKYIIGAAAAVTVIFIGMKLFTHNEKNTLEYQLAAMNKSDLDHYIKDQLTAISADELHSYIDKNIHDIDAGLFAETKYIDEEITQKQLIENVNLEILSDDVKGNETEPVLEDDMIKQIDDDVIEQLLLDESMYDDFAL